jgi:hypothetical protein
MPQIKTNARDALNSPDIHKAIAVLDHVHAAMTLMRELSSPALEGYATNSSTWPTSGPARETNSGEHGRLSRRKCWPTPGCGPGRANSRLRRPERWPEL